MNLYLARICKISLVFFGQYEHKVWSEYFLQMISIIVCQNA